MMGRGERWEEGAVTRKDQRGHPVRTTSDACVAAINSYYDQVLSYGRNRKVILEAVERDPECALANVLAAHFVSSKKPTLAAAYLAAAASRIEGATAYEKAVFRSVSCLLEEDRNVEVAVQVHRELCHVLQNDCCFNEVVDFMQACSPSWSACFSFMYTHNWWHVAVCYLEDHSSMENVLEVYEHFIWKELERKGCDCEEVHLNALGLLLRIAVRRQMDFIGDRLKILADIFSNESNWHSEWLGDILALWALSATEKVNKANGLVNSLKFRVSSMSKKKQQIAQQ